MTVDVLSAGRQLLPLCRCIRTALLKIRMLYRLSAALPLHHHTTKSKGGGTRTFSQYHRPHRWLTISLIVLTWGADKEKERKWQQRQIGGSEENIDVADAKATDEETQYGKVVPTTMLRCSRDDGDGQHDSCKY